MPQALPNEDHENRERGDLSRTYLNQIIEMGHLLVRINQTMPRNCQSNCRQAATSGAALIR